MQKGLRNRNIGRFQAYWLDFGLSLRFRKVLDKGNGYLREFFCHFPFRSGLERSFLLDRVSLELSFPGNPKGAVCDHRKQAADLKKGAMRPIIPVKKGKVDGFLLAI